MDHKVLEPIVEYLKQKNQLSPLESDFIETWNVLVSQPFDDEAAKQKMVLCRITCLRSSLSY